MASQNHCAIPSLSLNAIESAIKLIDHKKEELRKAFNDLQAKSSHLSFFCISWHEIDSHFSEIQSSVLQRFHLLESRDSNLHVGSSSGLAGHSLSSNQEDPSTSNSGQCRIDSVVDSLRNPPLHQFVALNAEQPASSNSMITKTEGLAPSASQIDSVVTRPQLKEFCVKMDGKGLRKYINDYQKERDAIRMELPGALQNAPDPGSMVLDAMEGFYVENKPKGDKDPELLGLRRVCVFLLEQLIQTGVNCSDEVRERAKKLAFEWKEKLGLSKDNSLETLAFLHLVSAYGLGAEVDKEELVGYFVIIARSWQATKLCRSIGLGEKVRDLIQKLLDSGKQLFAVRFVFEFGLAEKFPPVQLLKDYLKETKKLAVQVCKDGKNSLRSQNEATAKEIGALKAVIKIIEEHKLESEYSSQCLKLRIEQLEQQQAARKVSAATRVPNPQQQLQQQAKKQKQVRGKQQHGGNKRPRTTPSVVPIGAPLVAGSSSAVPLFQQSHLQPAGLLPDPSAAYLSSQSAPYGLAGSTPVVAPYAGSSAGLYGLSGAPISFPGSSHLYSYDRLTTYGAYGLPLQPQYHPSYHPQ